MSAKDNERLSLMDKILGKSQDDELKKALSRVAEILKRRGHETKEHKGKGVLEDIREELMATLSKLTDNPDEGIVDEVLAIMLGKLANAEPTPEEEAPETMMEEEPAPEDEDEEKKPTMEAFMELTSQVKALAAESTAIYKDVGEFIPAIIQMAQTVAALAPLVKETGKVDALQAQVKALEAKINSRPRQASQVAETVIENADLKKELEKGANGKKTFFNVPLKE